jgi:hypothetical protein
MGIAKRCTLDHTGGNPVGDERCGVVGILVAMAFAYWDRLHLFALMALDVGPNAAAWNLGQ